MSNPIKSTCWPLPYISLSSSHSLSPSKPAFCTFLAPSRITKVKDPILIVCPQTQLHHTCHQCSDSDRWGSDTGVPITLVIYCCTENYSKILWLLADKSPLGPLCFLWAEALTAFGPDSLFQDICIANNLGRWRQCIPLGQRPELSAVQYNKNNIALQGKAWADFLVALL